jgi:hypothetical protein
MAHQVQLPDHVYQIIQREAEKEGLTPAEWIAAAVARAATPISPDQATAAGERPLRDVLEGLVGSFNSSKENYEEREVSPMAEMVAEQLQKQGIEAPWRRQP